MKFLAPAALFTVSLIIVVALVDVSKVSMARGQRDTQTRMDERFSKAAAAQAELATPCLQSLGLLQSGSTQSRDGDQEKALDCLIKSIQHASDYELVSQIAKEGITWQRQYGAHSELQHAVIQGLVRAEQNAIDRQSAIEANYEAYQAEAHSWILNMLGNKPEESKSIEEVLARINSLRGNVISPNRATHQDATVE